MLLVNNGADMNIPNQYEKPPLYIYIENNHLIVLEFRKMNGTKSHLDDSKSHNVEHKKHSSLLICYSQRFQNLFQYAYKTNNHC